MLFKGERIYLRPVEKEDATRLLLWENNPKHWKVTGTEVPYSMAAMLEYIDQAQHIRSHGQLRFLICSNETQKPLGTIDLYNADFKHMRTAVGILIADELDRGQGYATEALALMENYVHNILAFENIYASVQADNSASERLFLQAGYTKIGRRKNWFFENQQWIDELLFQKWLKK
jgi:diamine N-acetyltransferase